MCLTPEGRQLKLMPWGGAAARLSTTSTNALPTGEEDKETALAAMAQPIQGQLANLPIKGQAFCFLPLPAETGLPVHTNGFFELSANRRDIWYGDDMVGAGKLRAEWNSALLQDVVAPSYLRLLMFVREQLKGKPQYYALWPQRRPAEPWGGLVDVLYQMLLQQSALFSEVQGGVWVSPVGAVFAASEGEDGQAAEVVAMDGALLRSGMPLVRVPPAVHRLLDDAAVALGVELRSASPAMVREWLIAQRSWEEGVSREEGMALLRHCVRGVGGETARSLRGLRVLPLLDGSWGRFEAAGEGTPLLLCSADERTLLERRPRLVVDVDPASSLGQVLGRIAASGETNLQVFSAGLVSSLLPSLLPARWRGLEVVELAAEGEGDDVVGPGAVAEGDAGPPIGWLLALWEYLGRHHADTHLGQLAGWPLLPAEGGRAYALPAHGLRASRMLDLSESDEALSGCVCAAGCLALHSEVSRVHPQLQHVVHAASACGILRAIRASSAPAHGASSAAVGIDPHPLVGQRVCIFGVSKAELNGACGTAIAFDADAGRYKVQLQGAARLLALKPANLRLVDEGGDGSKPATEFTVPTHIVGLLFKDVDASARRVLRAMLAERRHVEERELRADTELIAVLRALPIFEVHSTPSAVDEIGAAVPADGAAAGGLGGSEGRCRRGSGGGVRCARRAIASVGTGRGAAGAAGREVCALHGDGGARAAGVCWCGAAGAGALLP